MSAGGIQRVFLSHTSELRDHPQPRSFVAAAEDAVKRAGLLPIDMKYFPAHHRSVDDYLQQAVGSADVFVGIIGFQYGSLADGRSFTEREFDYATKRDLTRLVFILDEKEVVQLPAEQIRDLEHGTEQERFRQRLMGDRLVRRVATPGQLEAELQMALVTLMREHAGPERTPEFMAPELPELYVERRTLVSQLMDLLKPETPRTIGLYGDEGSGKRTLAAYVCREVRDRFPGGVVWATLGDRVDTEQLVKKINDLSEMLSGRRPTYEGLEAAGLNLGRLLETGRCLLVVDDVRDPGHLTPFLYRSSMRLITTRDRTLLPESALVFPVGPMTSDEALDLFRHGVGDVEAGELAELIRIAGGSPRRILLAMKAVRERRELGARPALAVAHVEACLADGRALDSPPAAASLELLKEGRPERLERYLKLAVFPEDTAIPVSTLGRYWGLDELAVPRLCRELANFSLVDDRDGIRVHGVLRVGAMRLAGYHRALLDAHRVGLAKGDRGVATAWWGMPHDEPYLWDHLERHLVGAGADGGRERDELLALRAHPSWQNVQAMRSRQDVVLEGHEAEVSAVAVRPDGSLVASADASGRILLRSWLDGSVHAELSGHRARVTALAFGPDGSWLVSASADHTLRLWQTDGTCRAEFRHAGPVNGMAISEDGHLVASAGGDGTVKLWNVSGGAGGYERITLRRHSGPVQAVAITPDGSTLASAGDDGILVWDTATGGSSSMLAEGSDALATVAISPDGRWLASAGRTGTVQLWNTSGGQSRGALIGHRGEVRALVIGPDGSWLASGGDDGAVRLWSVADCTARAVLTGHTGAVNALAVGRGGEGLASAGSDRTVRLWRIPIPAPA